MQREADFHFHATLMRKTELKATMVCVNRGMPTMAFRISGSYRIVFRIAMAEEMAIFAASLRSRDMWGLASVARRERELIWNLAK